MGTRTHIGKQVWIATELPETNNAAGFEALDWVRVNGFTGGLQLGFEAENIDIPDIASGITLGAKGMRSGVDSEMSFRRIEGGDEGQDDLKAAADGCGGVGGAIKIISADCNSPAAPGDRVQYAQGYFHSFKEMEIEEGSYEGATVNFKQNQPTVEAVEPAAPL
jgi:hypothetical protein